MKAKTDQVSTSQLLWRRWLTIVLTYSIAVGALASTVTYTYDELGRLTAVLYDDGTTTSYVLDAAGNRTTVTTSTSGGGGSATVHFGAASYVIDEDIGIFQLPVVRDGDTSLAFSVYCNTPTDTGSGYAQFGTDLVYEPSRLLTFAPGETTKYCNVEIIDDTAVESQEVFYSNVFFVTPPTVNVTIVAPSSIAIYIDDNDTAGGGAATVHFGAATYTIDEDIGTFQLPVVRSGDTSLAFSVYCSTASGTGSNEAQYGTDVVYEPSRLLTFGSGETIKYCNIQIMDDNTIESQEVFYANLFFSPAPTVNVSVAAPSSTLIYIDDDDTPGGGSATVHFGAASYTVDEDFGVFQLPVVRDGDTSLAFSVYCNTPTGTGSGYAQFGTDLVYEPSRLLTFAPGETTKYCNVEIIDDTAVESQEVFYSNVFFIAPPAVNVSIVTPSSITIYIDDDDGGGGGAPTAPGVPSFSNITTSSATVSWSAGGSGTTQYRYQVDGGSWLNVGTALTAALSGLSAGTTYTVAVQAGNASNQWSSSSSASFQTNPVGNPGTISITSPSQNQSENVNTFAVQVARTGGSAGPVSVSTVFAPGSATAADASISPASLSWADGNSAVQTITVTINDDSIIESTEYFDVQIANPTGGATLGTSSISIGINDNDAIPTVPNAYINYSQIAAGLNYTVSWSTPPNTTFFKLFRSINSNPFTEIYSGPNTSLLTNSPAGEYFYKVQACNASGCSSDSNTVDILVCGSSGCL